MPVHGVGNRERDLRDRLVAGQLEATHPHNLVVHQADQRHHARTAVRAYPPGLLLCGRPAQAEERKYRFSGDIASCSRLTAS